MLRRLTRLIERCRIHNVKPIWYLKPLQLSQVQPISLTQRPLKGPSPSLLSYCLTVISQNFHLVTPESFQSLPSHLARRVSVRLEADRGYGGETVYPDEATLWAYGAFTNPEETEKDCTVDLPSVVTVTTLSPNPLTNYEHPLVLIPRLFSSPSLSLLTTLTIGGVDDALSDANILSLRWCIQLTCLWTKGCRQLTDSGIRLLASSLELEEKRGPCRLRGWWLHGCGKVSDRSMRSFARWPGLVVLGESMSLFQTADNGRRERHILHYGRYDHLQSIFSSSFQWNQRRFPTLYDGTTSFVFLQRPARDNLTQSLTHPAKISRLYRPSR